MNKTININLDGFAFQMEDLAYEKLNIYLESIKNRLGGGDEANEIIGDIESRIAELFRNKFGSPNDIITLKAVEEIILTIGEPADIVDDEEVEKPNGASSESAGSQIPPYAGRKGLYRDPDDRIFGGVCAGLAAYMNVDPLIFRIIAAVSAFVSLGFTLLIYLVLWIAMPKALTLAQRIEMRGGISIKDIESGIKKEYEEVSSKFSNYKYSKNYKNVQRKMNQSGDLMSRGLSATVNVLATIIGIVLVVWAVLILMAIAGFFLFKETILGLIISEGHDFIASAPDRFLATTDQILLSVSVGILVVIPILVLLYLGLWMIFKFKTNSKLFGLSALILWVLGLVMVFFTGMRVVQSFETSSAVVDEQVLEQVPTSTIYLKPENEITNYEGRKHLGEIDHLDLFIDDSRLIVQGPPEVNIIEGEDFRIKVEKRARGLNDDSATFNAKNTEYVWSQKDSVLLLSKQFIIGEEALIRQQKVFVTIQIPYGKKLDVSPELSWLIDN